MYNEQIIGVFKEVILVIDFSKPQPLQMDVVELHLASGHYEQIQMEKARLESLDKFVIFDMED